METISGLKAYLQRIEVRLSDLLPAEGTVPEPLTSAMRYSALAPGKRLRPCLAMECCLACGGAPETALDAGCAIEFVHAFSLIHDDLPAIDNDDLRRGRPTCHIQFGEAMALLAGDALFALGFEVMAGSPAGLGGVQILARALGVAGVVGGEALDVLMENQSPSFDVLQRIHRDKTGALFAASCQIGGLCADGTLRPELAEFGHALGLAFQIADDILNETATPEALGKGAGTDRERGKLTYPALFGLDRSREMAAEAVAKANHAVAGLPGPVDGLRALAGYAITRGN